MDIGSIKKQEVTEEVKDSYLDYVMSVIVGRALPDVRDGLKPVHRRILFTMNQLGLSSNGKFRKSAMVVGETMARYHPHGDLAIYDALARMVQNFSLRYPLVLGQGNFGSLDNDPPAASRYTEAKLSRLAEELMADIEKQTVDFAWNYDATKQEPKVLPAKIPNLLINGASGIAVGMATNIPPHNLGEVIDATLYLIDNPESSTSDLANFIQGPDFPTGGIIFDKSAILEAYSTGKGPVLMRGRAEIEERPARRSFSEGGGKGFKVVIYEIPYQVSKADLITQIANLSEEKKIEGIKDLRDESDKEGMRIVIELGNNVYPQKILNQLYKYTELEKRFHLNILALTQNGLQPQLLSLKKVLEEYLAHRESVVKRRAEFDLKQAKDRLHILEGLKKALDKIDEVIKTIKGSADRDDAEKRLISQFKLTKIQANAILEMKLQTLARLERNKIEDEIKEKKKIIAELEEILKSPKRIKEVIRKELTQIKEKYADERKTIVVDSSPKEGGEIEMPEEETIVIVSRAGYVKRLEPQAFKAQKRGGKGIIGFSVDAEDWPDHFLSTKTTHELLFFTSKGRAFPLSVFNIPPASRIARGKAIQNFVNLADNETITALISLNPKSPKENKFLVIVTKKGFIKKTAIEQFKKIRASGIIAIKLDSGDELKFVGTTTSKDEIILTTNDGKALRFKESDVRPMGRASKGVRAMRIKDKDYLVVGEIIKPGDKEIVLVSECGFGKRVNLNGFRVQKRGGQGIIASKITDKTGHLVWVKIINKEEELMTISKTGQVLRTKITQIPIQGRATQGVRIMRLTKEDKISGATLI